jgi:integrase
VIAPASLLDETDGYVLGLRFAWLGARDAGDARPPPGVVRQRPRRTGEQERLPARRQRAGLACGFKATTHLLRATFACMLLARLEYLASEGAKVNPLLVVKILLGHEHIETTDRYLRAVAVDACVLKDVLDTLLAGSAEP